MADESSASDADQFNPLEPQSVAPADVAGITPQPVISPEEMQAFVQSAAAQASPSSHQQANRPGGYSSPSDIELLLNQAEQALASVNAPSKTPDELPIKPFKLQDFAGTPASTEAASLDLIRDVELDLKIELGRTQMHLEDVLRLRKGSVVPLDKLAGDPVDVYVNGRLIARGEVLVLNDNFCVRVAELITGEAVA